MNEETPKLGVVEIFIVPAEDVPHGIPLVVIRVHGGQGKFQEVAMDHEDAASVASVLAQAVEVAEKMTDPAKLAAAKNTMQ